MPMSTDTLYFATIRTADGEKRVDLAASDFQTASLKATDRAHALNGKVTNLGQFDDSPETMLHLLRKKAVVGNGKGLMIYIYRDGSLGDCTMNGVTSPKRGFKRMIVIGESVEGYIDVPENATEVDGMPIVRLTKGAMPGIARIVPVETEGKWSMFGGNFATTSDSRFSAAVETITGSRFYGAVAVHDRVEA